LFFFARVLPGVAHVTSGIAAIGEDKTGFHFFAIIISNFLTNVAVLKGTKLINRLDS
jgi:hypothetical protein